MYRMQRYDSGTTGMHFQIQKGGGFHYDAAEKQRQDLPVQVFLGGPPALLAAAVAPLPELFPELLLASFLLGKRLPVTQNHCPAEAEFLLQGVVKPLERRVEGPFGDHYGFYSLAHSFPVFRVQSVHHRRDAIYPATVVGKPPQEDFYLGDFLQNLFSPLFPYIMPGVRNLWTYGESGFHSLAAAIVEERYTRESLVHALRILGEGQLSLTKCLLITDQWIDLRNIYHCLTTILERFQPEEDLIVLPQTSADTLDYTGKKFNRGSKMILMGLGREPCRVLPSDPSLPDMIGISHIAAFCPGVLVLEGCSYTKDPQQAQRFLENYGDICSSWPLLILADSTRITRDPTSFLWSVFTRFDPDLDIHAHYTIKRHRLRYRLPILIDARHKPFYPDEVVVDETTERQVTDRWKTYFPHDTLVAMETFPVPQKHDGSLK